MEIPQLVIGNKNYSSWSLRAWLILTKLGIEFQEIRIPLCREGYQAEIRRYSSAGKVPVYLEDDLTIWDSLAIAEYFAEQHPELLPNDTKQRALARSLAAEMHSGFFALRSQMPMNCRATNRKVEPTLELADDLKRIQAIWTSCRNQNTQAGSWLFGNFTIVDAMYAPIVFRFNTYGVECEPIIADYISWVLNDPDLKRWDEAAKNETEIIQTVEVGVIAV
jgi:glutathione S-transferase